MKVSLKFLPVLLAIASTALAVAQSAPPWSKEANDPAARKGYVFRVSDVHNVPDLHGNPSDAKLVIFIGGNQFFVLPQLITAFEHHHPELKGHIFYETLPPRFAPSRSFVDSWKIFAPPVSQAVSHIVTGLMMAIFYALGLLDRIQIAAVGLAPSQYQVLSDGSQTRRLGDWSRWPSCGPMRTEQVSFTPSVRLKSLSVDTATDAAMGSRKFLIVTELSDPSRVILHQARPSDGDSSEMTTSLTQRGQMRSRRLSLVRKTWLVAALFLSLPSAAVRAQTSMTAFLPEVNSHFRLSANVRLVFDTKGYMEDGDLNRAQIGPSLQLNIRPFEKLERITIFDMDDMKPMPVVFTFGYRYLPSSVQPAIHRLRPIVMFHIPFPGTILLSDRNRGDLDWSNGSFLWTYRNRFTGERRLTIRSYHPGAYASAEFFYQSQYAKWSATHLFAGCLFPLSKHIQLDTYYEHANNTGPHPNHQVNAAGLIIDLYFPPRR